jgi:hypothetical protein
MSFPNQPENMMPIGEFNLNAERHEGFSFTDINDGYDHTITELHVDPNNPDMLAGEHTIADENGYLSGPHPVAVEAKRVRSGHEITIFLKDHKGELAAGAAGVMAVGVTLGSLFVRHKRNNR